MLTSRDETSDLEPSVILSTRPYGPNNHARSSTYENSDKRQRADKGVPASVVLVDDLHDKHCSTGQLEGIYAWMREREIYGYSAEEHVANKICHSATLSYWNNIEPIMLTEYHM